MLGSVVQVHLSPPNIPVHASRLLSTLIAAAAFACAGAAHAQLRPIPDDAKRGEVRHVREMIVAIEGTEAALSPGAQIRDASNRIILPGMLPSNGALAKYLVDPAGQVHRVWILTEEEAAKPDKKP